MHGDVWFFAPSEDWRVGTVVLDENESHHALHVLRARPPDVITVTDGRGQVARCALKTTERDVVIAEILERRQVAAPVPEIAVYQGAAKGTKNDEVVERLAELGVADMIVFTSRRSIVRWDERKESRLRDRWRDLAITATKRAKSAHAMRTHGVLGWSEMLERLKDESLPVALWEGADLPLRTALVPEARRIALVVGPEGGFESTEAEELAESGAQLVSLGPRIFRTESAPAFAASAVMYHYGTFG